ncbi:MAG TPA: hypothetical protein VMY34_01505 [Acidimicrobiales bacterium]|nr:hypothetical protein [Acidimicrobiales bacterium]
MSALDEVGERAGWRCWLCDEPVDPMMSVNDPRGPSLDAVITKAKAKKTGPADERLAHRGCNTKKGAIAPVVPWASHLFVADPAPIIGVVERLERKGGREVVARSPSEEDGRAAADWLVDRLSRLAPDLGAAASVEPGGGQFLVVLTAPRR